MKWPALAFAACIPLGWWSASPRQVAGAKPASSEPPAKKEARVSRIPEEVRSQVKSVREAKARQDRLREVVILATNIPVQDIARWYEGNYLEFLDGQLEAVFFAILEERWMEADPAGCAQWMVTRGGRDLTPFLARWMEADEAAALEFVRNRPIKQNDPAVVGLVKAMAGRDAGKALALVDEFTGRVQLPRETLGLISLKDREAVVSHVQAWNGERKQEALTSIAAAWLAKDMPWVVATLEREGIGDKAFDDLVNYMEPGDASKAILRNVDAIPMGWLGKLAERSVYALTYGNELAWLDGKSGTSKIPADILSRIQQRAADSWWYGERRTTGQELATNGDWLPMEARSKIAAKVAEGWKEDPEAARAWVATLEEPMKTAAQEGFVQMEKDLTRSDSEERRKTPQGLIEALQGDLSGVSFHRVGSQWDDAELKQAVDLASKMDPASAVTVMEKGISLPELPREVGGALLLRAMNSGELPPERQLRIYRMAAHWASEDPRWAGAWVEKMPEGQERIWAAKNVVVQWSRYAPEEALTWAQKLGAEESAAVLEGLD